MKLFATLDTEIKELARALYIGNDNPLESVKGEITVSDVVSDHNFLMKLVEIYKRLAHLPACTTMLEFNASIADTLNIQPSRHDEKFFWIQWVFEARLTRMDKPSIVECVHNALTYRRNVATVRRRVVLDMFFHYQEYLENRTPVIDPRNKTDYIAAIKDTNVSFFTKPKITTFKKYDYTVVRAQYLFIEKVIKQQKAG